MQGFTKLQSTKNNIKQAIINRGVPVASSDTFASYAQKVMNIITEGDTPAEKAALQDTIEREITSIEVRGVTYIGYSAFRQCINLTTANFLDVTNIGYDAFYHCTNLTTINFPNVTNIGAHAFSYCANLSIINFPNVTNIGSFAFNNCTNLTTINFPNVTNIGLGVFWNCSNLTVADFPNVTGRINYNVFNGCTNLTTANFPKVTDVGTDTFSHCTNLTTINFPNATYIGSSAFNYCTNLAVADFPSATNIVGAFQNCTNLSIINFPKVTNIGGSAFNHCTNLKRLELRANQVCTLVAINAFNNSGVAAGTGYVYVPYSLVDSYKAASNWVTYKEQIRALPDPTQLKTLTINNNVPTATYTYIINGEASAVTGNVLTNIPKYSVIEYKIEADGYTTVRGSIILEDNATIDITMTTPSWHSFTQPVLTANGTLGGDAFAVAGSSSSATYAAWRAFDGSTASASYFRPASGSYDLIFYNPYPLKVSQLVLTYTSSSYSDYSTIILSVSDDNVTWTQLKSFTVSRSASQTLAVDSSTGYLYYKITFTRGTSVRLKHCAITAQEYS